MEIRTNSEFNAEVDTYLRSNHPVIPSISEAQSKAASRSPNTHLCVKVTQDVRDALRQ